jgi:photosystem II stability/assembly factor-like uncharacterized protein
MNYKPSLRVIALLLLLGLILFPLTTLHAQESGFTETFNDPKLPNWERSPSAKVVDDVLHIDPGGYVLHSGEWGDLNLTVRASLVGEGFVVVSYRVTEIGDYSIRISADEITLYKAGEPITQKMMAYIPPGEWFWINVVAVGDSHEISLNGQLVLKVPDPDPLPPGGVGLSVQGQAKGEFDDLTLVSMGKALQPEEPGATKGAPPTQETGEEPTETPSVSVVGVPAYQSEPWVVLGGPPGGIGYDIRMVPENPDIMYVTDSGGGIFKSINGGQSWVPINQGIESQPSIGTRVFCATIDPHDSNTIWIGTQMSARIYRSTDGGQTWEERDNGIIPFQGEHSVRGITIDPNDTNTVYTAFENSATINGLSRSSGEVYKSTDAGLNWTRIWQGQNLARYIWIDPRNTQRLFVSTGIFDRIAANADPDGKGGGVGVLRSEDGGQTWTELNEKNGLNGGLYIPSLFIHPQNPDILIAAVSAQGGKGKIPGVYMTHHGRHNWKLIREAAEETGAEKTMEAVEISISDPNVWYAAGPEVIHRSEDGGKTWQNFPMRTPDRGSGFPIDIQVDPRDPNRLFVNNYGGGNMLSTDGGETWVDASRGYSGAGIWGVYVDPTNSLTVTVSGNTANFRSTDGGQTWRGIRLGRTEETRNWSFRGRILSYPEGSGTHIIASGDFNLGYVFHSMDGGNTWEGSKVVDIQEMIANGELEGEQYLARAFAFAPSDPQIVYIGYSTRPGLLGSFIDSWKTPPGFFRSQDGGYTWEHVENTPFADVSILTLAVSPDDPRTLYVATMVGVFRSQDGGDTWQSLETLEAITPTNPAEKNPPIFVITTDPFDSGIVYAGSPRGGVFRSKDGGDTWEQASFGMDPNESIYDLLPDPNRPGVLYASTSTSGVYYTTDRGENWIALNDGISGKWVDQLALSGDGSVLYAATHVSGVLRLGTPSSAPALNSGEKPAEPRNGGWPCVSGMLPLVLAGLVGILRKRN